MTGTGVNQETNHINEVNTQLSVIVERFRLE